MIGSLVLAVATGLLPAAAAPAAAAPVAAAPAAAAPSAVCAGRTGVTVVVDFGARGGTSTRCAAGDPTSASQALTAAGFSQVRVQQQPAFLCRIDGVPGPKDDACVRTPPATAYWSLWTARRGGSWTFSQLGVDALDPLPDTLVGFAFGASNRPGVAPPAAAPAASSSPTSPTGTTGGAPTSRTSRSAVPSSQPRQSRPSRSPAAEPGSPPPSPAPRTSTLSTGTSGQPASTPDGTVSGAAASVSPTASHGDGGGGSLAPWAGVGLVAVVGVAALTRAARRRSR